MRRTFACALIALLAACGGSDTNGGNGNGGPDAAPNQGGGDGGGTETTWSWVPVDGTQCMDGSATGMGVNLLPGSKKLVIYLEGGGACFNSFTCSGVAHDNGFGENDLATFAGSAGSSGLFNRGDSDNPLAGYSFAFIPYCSGDIFAGDNDNGFGGRIQAGYRNMGFYVDELLKEFPDVDRVVLTGSSAGGFGAAYNYDRVQQAFGDVPVTLIDDSGPPLSDKYMTPCLQQHVREVWNLDATLPADCADCTQSDGSGLSNLVTYLGDKYTDRDFGIISSTRDGVIRLFYGWGWPNCTNPQVPMPEGTFAAGIAELRDQTLKGYDNVSMYTIDSGLHVWLLENPLGLTTVGDKSITDWMRAVLANDHPASVAPPTN